MVIKDPDKLASKEKEIREITFEQQQPSKNEIKTHAKVIEIEDPNREEL